MLNAMIKKYAPYPSQPPASTYFTPQPPTSTFLSRMQSKAANHLICAFLRRILLRMKELGVSQTELAKRMQVSRPYITKVLHQDVNITFRTAAKLASALKMDFFPDLRPREVTQKLPNMV